MNIKDFENAVNKQIERCVSTLNAKGTDYADNAKVDRLNHFKVAAALMETTPEAALMGMLSKHVASISKMCLSDVAYAIEIWDEKITDTINYLLILAAMLRERN